jgi:hypothetical protein
MLSLLLSPLRGLARANLGRVFLGSLVLAASLAAAGCNRGKTAPAAQPAPPTASSSSDPNAHTFEKAQWLESCMKSCRRSAPSRLPSLSPPDREQHCTISCGCGLAHMTDPGPGPGQVHAPSARWQSETEEQHQAGVRECLDRAAAEVAASHAHPG